VLVLATSVGVAVAAELRSSRAFRRCTLGDGSAFLTGLLIGLLMPPGVPLYVPSAASVFAILVVKQSFGGLGRNWMNPALGGLVFALLSWGGAMTRWAAARGAPMSPALPPLEALRSALAATGAAGGSPLAILEKAGYPFSAVDASVVAWINTHVLLPLGTALRPGVFDMLTGHLAGRIGEVSAPLLLAGAGYLLARRIVRWEVPVLYIGTFGVLAGIFGGLSTGQGWLAGGPGFHILSGSLILGAFFMAGDPVTSPMTLMGRRIYGIGLGFLTFLLRFYGSLGDGVAVAILLGNCAVPLLDRLMRRRVPASLRGGIE
jgi:electron transport complex protein RnfD